MKEWDFCEIKDLKFDVDVNLVRAAIPSLSNNWLNPSFSWSCNILHYPWEFKKGA